MSNQGSPDRGHWQSRLGFVLAAAGSAIGLGNIWKFPYITGVNGGGWFVLIYLICIATVGLPVMIGEIIVGRAAQRSPVSAYESLSGGKLVWSLVGWMGFVVSFVIMSYYSVVAGWAMEYIKLAVTDSFRGETPEAIKGLFGALYGSFGRNVFWHTVFMGFTVFLVAGGVQKGIERASRLLMPILFAMLIGLVAYSLTLQGFGSAAEFIFAPNAKNLTPAGVLEALGHSFFTLSLGMGTMLTYGSYLQRNDDVVHASTAITVLDTMVALMACLIMFPVLFTAGEAPSAGPGLVFQSMPIAFATIPGGLLLSIVFFVLLLFAALTSAISILEVVVSIAIDKFGMRRVRATLLMGVLTYLYGIPSSDSSLMLGKRNFFDTMDYLCSNIMLPVGGLFIAIFVGWVMPRSQSYENFNAGKQRDAMYRGWLILIRYFVPVGILLVLLYSLKVIPSDWLK